MANDVLENEVAATEEAGTQEQTPEQATTVEKTGEAETSPKTEKTGDEVDGFKKDPDPKVHDDRRWNTMLERLGEHKARADILERQIQELTQRSPAQQPEAKPARDAYASDEEYWEALTDYKVKVGLQAAEQRLAEKTATQQMTQTWSGKLDVARQAYSDFDEAIADISNIPVTKEVLSAMSEAMMSSDVGADVLYYLSKNPGEARRLSLMPPVSAIREIGRIESYIEHEKTQKQTKAPVSKAPEPITPVRGTTSPTTKVVEDMTMDEYMAYEDKRQKARNKR